MNKDMHLIFFLCLFYNIQTFQNQKLHGDKQEIQFFMEKINDAVEKFAREINKIEVNYVFMLDLANEVVT